MHSLLVTFGGLGLLALMVAVARMVSTNRRLAMTTACKYFIPLWAIVAAANMAVGVLQAGYTVAQELPFFCLVFGVPAAIAFYVNQRFQRLL